MKKENLFSDEFLKQFKSRNQLNSFSKELQNHGNEKMLEGELDGHLDYDKSQKSGNSNTRNGFGQKKVHTSFGESQIQIPRDREASFNPIIVLKRGNMVNGIENVIVSLYTKRMCNNDIEEQIREVYIFWSIYFNHIRDYRKSDRRYWAWQNRPLKPVYLIV